MSFDKATVLCHQGQMPWVKIALERTTSTQYHLKQATKISTATTKSFVLAAEVTTVRLENTQRSSYKRNLEQTPNVIRHVSIMIILANTNTFISLIHKIHFPCGHASGVFAVFDMPCVILS